MDEKIESSELSVNPIGQPGDLQVAGQVGRVHEHGVRSSARARGECLECGGPPCDDADRRTEIDEREGNRAADVGAGPSDHAREAGEGLSVEVRRDQRHVAIAAASRDAATPRQTTLPASYRSISSAGRCARSVHRR